MKAILAGSLGVSLGLLASTGRADDVVWRAARTGGTQPAPAAAPTAAPNAHVDSPGVIVIRPAGQPDVPVPAAVPANPPAAPAADDATWARAQLAGDPPMLPPPPLQMRPAAPALPSMPAYATATSPAVTPYGPMMTPGPVSTGGYPDAILPASPLTDQYAGTGRAPRLLVTGEYLSWWTRRATGPALVTTSPPGMNGFLPDAAVLLKVSDLDDTYRPGGRFGLVYWFDDCASCGFDGRYFFTGERGRNFTASSDQFPNLFRPFFAANDALGEFSEQVTAAGVSVGSVSADYRSRFWGAEANYRDNFCCRHSCTGGFRADLLVGFRYLNLDEDLNINEDFTRLVPNTITGEPAGTRVLIHDRFATDNDFYGGQIGTVMEYRRNRWNVDLRTAVALGTTHQQLRIEGNQTRIIPGQAPLAFQGGLLALNSNSGTFTRDEFSVVPEIGLNLGYQMTEHLRGFVGYNFLYWTNVIRPGDQIDRVIDVNRVPQFAPPGIPDAATPRPAVLFNNTDFWAQGVNVGLEYRW